MGRVADTHSWPQGRGVWGAASLAGCRRGREKPLHSPAEVLWSSGSPSASPSSHSHVQRICQSASMPTLGDLGEQHSMAPAAQALADRGQLTSYPQTSCPWTTQPRGAQLATAMLIFTGTMTAQVQPAGLQGPPTAPTRALSTAHDVGTHQVGRFCLAIRRHPFCPREEGRSHFPSIKEDGRVHAHTARTLPQLHQRSLCGPHLRTGCSCREDPSSVPQSPTLGAVGKQEVSSTLHPVPISPAHLATQMLLTETAAKSEGDQSAPSGLYADLLQHNAFWPPDARKLGFQSPSLTILSPNQVSC